MDLDIIFVLGLVVGAFSIPALVSAFSDKRLPKLAVLMMFISAGLIVYVVRQDPDTYALNTLDEAVVRVVGRLVN